MAADVGADVGVGVGGQQVCGLFLQHKGRPCRMLVKAGRRYCGQHLLQDEEHQVNIGLQFSPLPCFDDLRLIIRGSSFLKLLDLT